MRLIQHIPKNWNKIFVVGEAPGADEAATGRPFIGFEGQILRKAFKQAGITFNNCFVTNTVHKRPPGNKYYLLKNPDILAGQKQLQKDIERRNPNLIIAVGGKALEMLTDKKGITKYRGSVLESTLVHGKKVLAILHPGSFYRGSEMGRFQPLMVPDLKKAKKESLSPEIAYPERKIRIIKNHDAALTLLNNLSGISTPVVCDIETIGPMMSAYGIATSPSVGYSICKELLRDKHVLRALSMFCYSSTPKIFHNALFDCLHNQHYYHIINNNIFMDTMIAQHAIYPVLPKSLAFCASIYTNEPYWKDVDHKATVRDWDKYYVYNGKDCCLTYEVYEKQQPEIEQWNVREILNLMLGLMKPFMFAMSRGTLIDKKAIAKFRNENEAAIENLLKIKDSLLGDINLNSHVQLKKLIYEDWKMPVQKVKGKVTIQDRKLKRLESFNTPYKGVISYIRKYKKTVKRRDFYRLKVNTDGRIRTSLKITGTYTGRPSSSESIFGSGKNLLNIPKETRKFYIADPGKIFIQGDLSQSEARIVAALTGDRAWVRKFDEIDIHREVASQIFHVKYEDVTTAQRNTAKRVAHGSHYGLGKILLAEMIGCSAKEAQRLKDNYYAARPGLKPWQDRVKIQLTKTRQIRTVFGRVIQFFGPITEKMMRDAVAAEPQSTSADYLDSGLIRIYNENIPSWEFRLCVYDSILRQVDDDIETIMYTIKKMKELIEVPITINGIELVIPFDCEIGYSWGTLHEVKDDVEKVHNEILRIS